MQPPDRGIQKAVPRKEGAKNYESRNRKRIESLEIEKLINRM